MNRKRNLAVKLAIGLALTMHIVPAQAQERGQDEPYLVGVGMPGSVPYNFGVGLSSLAQLVLLPEENLNLSPVTSDSYGQSLRHVIDGTAQFAVVDSVSAYQAAAESGDQLMAVATLWHEADHFIIANEYVQSGTISDLAILRSEDLATNLGNLDATSDLLNRFGVRMDKGKESSPSDWDSLRQKFDQGLIAGLAVTGPVPSATVLEMLNQRDGRAQLLEFSHWQMAQIGKGWHVHSLTADDYPGLTTQVDTVARTLMLVAHREVPEEVVYHIVKLMYDNLPYLANLDEAAAQISLDHALEEIDLPLHPGAARYFQEVSVVARGSGDSATAAPDAAMDHSGHSGGQQPGSEHVGHANGALPPEHLHDEAMLTRARAEVHEGKVILKIGRPPVLTHPETEIATVYFGFGKTDLAEDGIAKVREITSKVMAVFDTYGREPEVYVEGHTDSVGSWETNYEIAYRRARSVGELLVAEGVPESWVHISDYSEQGLAVPTADGVAEERNRRVEITIIPQE